MCASLIRVKDAIRNGVLDYKSNSAREIEAVLRERKYFIEKEEDPEIDEIL